jgi:hypothetical protein
MLACVRTAVVVIVLAAACGTSEPTAKSPEDKPVTDKPGDKPTDTEWSQPVDGIRIKLVAPGGAAKAGSTITMSLVVENTSDVPRRIYMLGPEAFRATLSDLWLLGADGKPIGMSQPQPRPHGYLPTEADFPEIAAHASKTFQQSLRIDPSVPAGPATVRWELENRVTKMEGGLQTLDGITKPLFGGGPIPGIWVGELSAKTAITIER